MVERVRGVLDNGLVGPAGLPLLPSLQVGLTWHGHLSHLAINCVKLLILFVHYAVCWATGTTGGPMMEFLDQVWLHVMDNIYQMSQFAAYWGLINPAWTMCNKGRRQSPVNIDPASLTFDPSLTPLQVKWCSKGPFHVSKGGQAHGLGEDHKHRTESGFQVSVRKFSLYVIIFAFLHFTGRKRVMFS